MAERTAVHTKQVHHFNLLLERIIFVMIVMGAFVYINNLIILEAP
ncbi:hypothetical protein SAMN05216232_0666 [Virgibacillus subterraneus]|uniref:Uncharacterized protein n=2 Tax=Virgibacillus TaxID=84406 RepID=A0A1H0YBH0_9BACI|nr:MULTISPECIES: hypothetical protein [Virgibacillus]SDQ12226.1 hypothetical protein SAMN05216231_0538 [Virgibacillus salinus]SEP71458.1 hypothetical protein SAMN05216232_0666 [Virgibacillus subterraneus]